VATIEEMQRLKLVERAAELEPYVREKLEALKAKHRPSATCAASASSLPWRS
jgi:4-aminobutyrate aminotransferase-like enzyme